MKYYGYLDVNIKCGICGRIMKSVPTKKKYHVSCINPGCKTKGMEFSLKDGNKVKLYRVLGRL